MRPSRLQAPPELAWVSFIFQLSQMVQSSRLSHRISGEYEQTTTPALGDPSAILSPRDDAAAVITGDRRAHAVVATGCVLAGDRTAAGRAVKRLSAASEGRICDDNVVYCGLSAGSHRACRWCRRRRTGSGNGPSYLDHYTLKLRRPRDPRPRRRRRRRCRRRPYRVR